MHAPQPQNFAKKTQNHIFLWFKVIQVINVDTTKKLVTIACYDKQHVCVYM